MAEKQMAEPIRKIVIVGGGTAGWMTAASLIRYAEGKSIAVSLIESSKIPTIGVGEATIPNIVQFNRNLGIDEIEFVKATQATFKLGIQFENWHQQGQQFFHPFADYGLKIDQVDFHQYLHRLKASGISTNLEDYCFPAVLARYDKFAQPHPNPASPLADYSYAYHFDAGLYANFLRDFSVKLGVEHIDAEVKHTQLHPNTGFIKSLLLDNGMEIHGDLFIDCSGFKGLLIEQALETGYEYWNEWLLCDAAVAVQSERAQAPHPYTRAIAMSAGWQWRIPLQHRSGNGYIYSSQFETDANAQQTLLETIEGKAVNQPRKIIFHPGRRKKIWHKNCFAIGLSSGFLEPLESTSISLIQTAIAKLLTFFPDQSFNEHDIAEVNRLHHRELENIRDFLILHYKLTQRDDSPFWRYCKDMAIPDSLAHKISVYKSRGHIVMLDNESFKESSWLAMYNGFHITPQRFDVRAGAVEPTLIKQKLDQMSHSIDKAAQQAMSHDQFIKMHCPAAIAR